VTRAYERAQGAAAGGAAAMMRERLEETRYHAAHANENLDELNSLLADSATRLAREQDGRPPTPARVARITAVDLDDPTLARLYLAGLPVRDLDRGLAAALFLRDPLPATSEALDACRPPTEQLASFLEAWDPKTKT